MGSERHTGNTGTCWKGRNWTLRPQQSLEPASPPLYFPFHFPPELKTTTPSVPRGRRSVEGAANGSAAGR